MSSLRNSESYIDNLTYRIRQGRIGSSWRHIKQTNNYSGSNLLFIDGTVKIEDTTRFPQRQMGNPPRIPKYDEEMLGFTSKSLNDLNLPLYQGYRTRHSLKSNGNKFHEHAKDGFEYWLKDRRLPENNKSKAKPIGIGQPYFKSGF